jgi:hypothetical protein
MIPGFPRDHKMNEIPQPGHTDPASLPEGLSIPGKRHDHWVSREQHHVGPGTMGHNHRPTRSLQEGSQVPDSNPLSPGVGSLPPEYA